MKIALAQIEIDQKIDKNLRKALYCIEEASSKNAKIICFPELQFSPHFPQKPKKNASKYLMDVNCNEIECIRRRCKKCDIIAIINAYLRIKWKKYDGTLVVDKNGDLLGISTKTIFLI